MIFLTFYAMVMGAFLLAYVILYHVAFFSLPEGMLGYFHITSIGGLPLRWKEFPEPGKKLFYISAVLRNIFATLGVALIVLAFLGVFS